MVRFMANRGAIIAAIRLQNSRRRGIKSFLQIVEERMIMYVNSHSNPNESSSISTRQLSYLPMAYKFLLFVCLFSSPFLPRSFSFVEKNSPNVSQKSQTNDLHGDKAFFLGRESVKGCRCHYAKGAGRRN